MNITEICASKNAVQFITGYVLKPNVKSNVEMPQDRLSEIKSRTDVEDLYFDGAYYGEDTLDAAEKNSTNLHFTDMTGRKRSSPHRI